MSEDEKTQLVVKVIRTFCQEHYGWDAKYYPEDIDKYAALMEMADRLESEVKDG